MTQLVNVRGVLNVVLPKVKVISASDAIDIGKLSRNRI